VAAWVLLRRLRLGRPAFGAELGTVAVAAVPGVAWLVGLRVFFSAHPDYAMTDLSLRPQRRILAESLDRPAQFFHVYAPELWRAWWIPVVALAVLVVVLVSTRRWARAVPAVLVAVLVLAVMSTTRAALVRDIFVLPKARLLAGLPYALWFLVGLATGLDDDPSGRPRRALPPHRARTVVAGVALLALGTAGERLAGSRPRRAKPGRYRHQESGRSGPQSELGNTTATAMATWRGRRHRPRRVPADHASRTVRGLGAGSNLPRAGSAAWS